MSYGQTSYDVVEVTHARGDEIDADGRKGFVYQFSKFHLA